MLLWIRPLLELFRLPGYIEDGIAWTNIFNQIGCSMTTLDIVLLSVGVPFFIYAFTPQKFRVWEFWTTNPKESEADRDSQESKKKNPGRFEVHARNDSNFTRLRV